MRRQTSHWAAADSKSGLDAGRFGAMLIAPQWAKASGPPTLFADLTDTEIDEVISVGRRKVVHRGATLFRQGTVQDGVYLVETGRIQVFYVGPSGRELTLAYWHPGNFVGGPEVFSKAIHIWSGVAAINSSVLHLPGHILRDMVMRMPTLAINVIKGLSFKGRCYSALAQMLGTHSPTERLTHLLLHLSDLYGVEEPQGILIAASFTHADLAHMIGVTRQWVTNALKRYAELGIVHMHGTNIVVRDVEALQKTRDEKPARGVIAS